MGITVEPVDDPAKSKCLKCRIGNHAKCLWRVRPTECACVCPWLEVDIALHFPSLRGNR